MDKLSNSIMESGIVHRVIIILLKRYLYVVLCIFKFQSDLLNQKFFPLVGCESAKYLLKKDI